MKIESEIEYLKNRVEELEKIITLFHERLLLPRFPYHANIADCLREAMKSKQEIIEDEDKIEIIEDEDKIEKSISFIKELQELKD